MKNIQTFSLPYQPQPLALVDNGKLTSGLIILHIVLNLIQYIMLNNILYHNVTCLLPLFSAEHVQLGDRCNKLHKV